MFPLLKNRVELIERYEFDLKVIVEGITFGDVSAVDAVRRLRRAHIEEAFYSWLPQDFTFHIALLDRRLTSLTQTQCEFKAHCLCDSASVREKVIELVNGQELRTRAAILKASFVLRAAECSNLNDCGEHDEVEKRSEDFLNAIRQHCTLSLLDIPYLWFSVGVDTKELAAAFAAHFGGVLLCEAEATETDEDGRELGELHLRFASVNKCMAALDRMRGLVMRVPNRPMRGATVAYFIPHVHRHGYFEPETQQRRKMKQLEEEDRRKREEMARIEAERERVARQQREEAERRAEEERVEREYAEAKQERRRRRHERRKRRREKHEAREAALRQVLEERREQERAEAIAEREREERERLAEEERVREVRRQALLAEEQRRADEFARMAEYERQRRDRRALKLVMDALAPMPTDDPEWQQRILRALNCDEATREALVSKAERIAVAKLAQNQE